MRGRYLPDQYPDSGGMAPELARRAVAAYSEPGDLIVETICDTGTTLVEAVHFGRRAIGVETDDRKAALARANAQHAKKQGAAGTGQALCGDPSNLGRLLAHRARTQLERSAERAGAVTALPYARFDPILTAPRADNLIDERVRTAAACAMKPGGFVVVVVKHRSGTTSVRRSVVGSTPGCSTGST